MPPCKPGNSAWPSLPVRVAPKGRYHAHRPYCLPVPGDDLVQYKGPLPRRLTRSVNSVVTGLRSAPLSRQLLSRHVNVVTYTGRRSGRTFSTLVGYQRAGDTVTITVRRDN